MPMGLGVHAMRVNQRGQSGRTTMPLRPTCREMCLERTSRTANIDHNLSNLNVYHLPDGVTNGSELAAWFSACFEKENAERVSRGERRMPPTSNLGGTFTMTPDEESMRKLTREQQLAVCDAMIAGWSEWAGHRPDAWAIHFDEGSRPGTSCHIHIIDRMLKQDGSFGTKITMSRGRILEMHRVIPAAVNKALPDDIREIVGGVTEHRTAEQRQEMRARGEYVIPGGLDANTYRDTREALRERDKAREEVRSAETRAHEAETRLARALTDATTAETRAEEAERRATMAEDKARDAEEQATELAGLLADMGEGGNGREFDVGDGTTAWMPSLGQVLTQYQEATDAKAAADNDRKAAEQELERQRTAIESARRQLAEVTAQLRQAEQDQRRLERTRQSLASTIADLERERDEQAARNAELAAADQRALDERYAAIANMDARITQMREALVASQNGRTFQVSDVIGLTTAVTTELLGEAGVTDASRWVDEHGLAVRERTLRRLLPDTTGGNDSAVSVSRTTDEAMREAGD